MLIEQLHDQKRRADEQLQRLKYSSSKPGVSRRPNARTGGEGVSDAQSKYERMRNKHEHMKSVFLTVRAGIGNIARKLDADGMLHDVPLESMGASEMAALLEAIEKRAATLLEAIDLEEEAMEAAAAVAATAPAVAHNAAAKKGGAELELGPGNIRIKDPTEREEDVQDGAAARHTPLAYCLPWRSRQRPRAPLSRSRAATACARA